MTKFFKYMSLIVVPAFALAMTACNDKNVNDDYPRTPENPDSTTGSGIEGVYFPTGSGYSSTIDVSAAEHTVDIPIYRGDTEGTITVPVTVTPLDDATSDIYSFDDSVTFENGEKVGYLKVSYDPEELEYDQEIQFEIEIDEKYATPYGVSTQIFTLVMPSPWTEIGIGIYTDSFLQDGQGNIYGVETYFFQSETNPYRFRVSNPYYPLNQEETYFEFEVIQKGTTYMGQEVTYDNLVAYDEYLFMYIEDYDDDAYISFPANFQGYETPDKWVYNTVVSYQSNGLPGEIQIAPFYYMYAFGGGWDFTTDPTIHIYFPGADIMDTSLSLTYEGVLLGVDDSSVLVDVEKGSDLTNVRVAVDAGTNVDQIANAIKNDTMDYVEVTSDGLVKLPFNSGNPAGRYTIVAVGYIDNEARAQASTTFTYAGTTSDEGNWKSLGYTNYTEAYICSLYTTGTYTYSLEIQENTGKAGYYRLVNPYGSSYPLSDLLYYESDRTCYMYIDASNPERVRVLESPQTVIVDVNYGALTVGDQIDYWLGQGYDEDLLYDYGYFGTLANGKITFNPGALALWEGSDGPYKANYVVNSTGQDYETNPDGTYYAPFLVDIGNITATPQNASVSSHGAINHFSKANRPLALKKSLFDYKGKTHIVAKSKPKAKARK